MAWEKCKVSLGKGKHDAQLKGSQIFLPFEKGMKVGDSISLNGKSMQVNSWELDPREEALIIDLAMASSEKEKEKSDGKPKGPDKS